MNQSYQVEWVEVHVACHVSVLQTRDAQLTTYTHTEGEWTQDQTNEALSIYANIHTDLHIHLLCLSGYSSITPSYS